MTVAGLEHYRAAILGYLPEGSMGENWGTAAPGYLWPLWGVALGAATYAYYLRGAANAHIVADPDRSSWPRRTSA